MEEENENGVAPRRYPIPRYIPAQKYQSNKGGDNMYPFKHLGFNLNEVEERNEDILKNLTLFAPYNHEDDMLLPKSNVEPASIKDIQSQELLLERPVTPINDEIKAPPPTFQRLAKLVRRRIVPKPGVCHLGIDDQKELAAIIMGEVNGIWTNIKMQVEDPFLTTEENKELQRRITVHIVTVCEQLFVHYLQKAQILNKRGVFSGPANMSRLKAQLALDANKFLNILTIRRYIVSDLKCQRESQQGEDDRKISSFTGQQFPLLSYRGLIEASRPKSKNQKRRPANSEEDIMEIEENMPDLDTGKLMNLLRDLPTDRIHHKTTDAHTFPGKSRTSKGKEARRKTSADLCREKLILQKCDSAPLLSYGETLGDELGLGSRTGSAASLGDIEEEESVLPKSSQRTEVLESKPPKPAPGTWEYQQEDLRRLVARGADDNNKDADSEEDLPPLLQAVTSTEKQEERKQRIEQQLKDLEARERQRLAEDRIDIREPTHPQPATVSTKMPNKMVVRTSDVRVSDRVCLSSITLGKHNTVYNDLVDEIDPVIVKQLDSNLFLGDEITEVYKEIMKTVPTDHLDLENDALVEPAADALDLSSALASSTLHKRKSERIVNPNLRRTDEPPWGTLDVNDWAKTPFSPPTDMKGRPMVNPMVPVAEGLAMNDFYGAGVKGPEQAPPGMGGMPDDMPEVMARSYASWLAWWKNTINSDDYMKYLSTQESDYMGAIFHFYNSDDDDEDDEDDDDFPNAPSRATKKSKQLQLEEKVRKVAEIKAAKTEFNNGFWNVNSVLLGGLGQDPTLEGEDSETVPKSPTTEVAPSHGPRNRSVLVSRKSQHKSQASDNASVEKLTKGRDGGVSRHSHADTKGTGVGSQRGGLDTEGRDTMEAQERLEKVWTSLRMPDNLKLDMAIKYSSDGYHQKLNEAIEVWEEATALVLQREELIAKLEAFERLASDPNRFFEKGQRGSSVARLEEARMRSYYYKKIESAQEQLAAVLGYLNREYQDALTFQGRPYLDKMHWDRTEMLYWLQEERKQQAMEYEARLKNLTPLSLKMAHVEPLASKIPSAVN